MRKRKERPIIKACLEAMESRLLLDVSGVWMEMGFRSASGGGVSYSTSESLHADLVVDLHGYPVVAWEEGTDVNANIYVARYDGLTWAPLGLGAASGTGIGQGHTPRVAVDSARNTAYVAWVSGAPETAATEIYLKYWNGSDWLELGGSATGGGISNDTVISEEVALGVGLDSLPVVAYRGYDEESNDFEIVCKKWTGTIWIELTDSDPFPYAQGGLERYYGGGVSNDVFNSFNPSLIIGPDNAPAVAWASRPFGQAAEIYMRRWNGSAWENVGASASLPVPGTSGQGQVPVPGISNTPIGESVQPQLVAAPSPDDPRATVYTVAWLDYDNWLDRSDATVYMRTYDQATDEWVEFSPGSAGGDGLAGLFYGQRASLTDLDVGLNPVSGLPAVAFAVRSPLGDENGRFQGVVFQAERDLAGNINWVLVADDSGEVNNAAQEARFPRVEFTPDGQPVVSYTNLLMDLSISGATVDRTGTIVDEYVNGVLTRLAPYDAYNMPLGHPVPQGVAPVDSEVVVNIWDGTHWGDCGPGSGDLGGVENILNESGVAYNSPPQAAVAADGSALMAYLQREFEPGNRYDGQLVPRVIRFDEASQTWVYFGDVPQLSPTGAINAPIYGGRQVDITTVNSHVEWTVGTLVRMKNAGPDDWVGIVTNHLSDYRFEVTLIHGHAMDVHVADGVEAVWSTPGGGTLIIQDSIVGAELIEQPWPLVVRDEYFPLVGLLVEGDPGWSVNDLVENHIGNGDKWTGLIFDAGTTLAGNAWYAVALLKGDWMDVSAADGVELVSNPAESADLQAVDLLTLTQVDSNGHVTASLTLPEQVGTSWVGDMLLVSSDPRILSNMNGTPALAYVDSENLEDSDPAVYGHTTITVFSYDEDMDTWGRLAADPNAVSGPGWYSYVSPGRVSDGWLVDQAEVVSSRDGQIALFWRQVDPTRSVEGSTILTSMSFVRAVDANGHPVVDANGDPVIVVDDATGDPTGRSDIYGMLYNPHVTIDPGSGNDTDPIDPRWEDFNGVPNRAHLISEEGAGTAKYDGKGLDFAPSACVTTTGQLVVAFSGGRVVEIASTTRTDVNGTAVPDGSFIQDDVVVMMYSGGAWGRMYQNYQALTAAAGTSNWNPSLAMGMDAGPLPTWTNETYVPMMYGGTDGTQLVDFDTRPTYTPTGDVTEYHVVVTGFWVLGTSDIQAAQWNTQWSRIADVTTTGRAVMPSAYGNGSQFPTVAWTDAEFSGAGYPFVAHATYTPLWGIVGFLGWVYAGTTYEINLGAVTGQQFGGVQMAYSHFDERRMYFSRVDYSDTVAYEIVADPNTGDLFPVPRADPSSSSPPNVAMEPDTESIHVRRWNPNTQVWEQLLYRDAGGNNYGSATGNGISMDWAPGAQPDVVIHTIGQTGLESQPAVVWRNVYEESIYARQWAHRGLTPFIVITEASGTINDNRLEFGELYYTDEGTQSFTISNTGAANLVISSIRTDSPSLSVKDTSGSVLNLPLTIPKYGSRTVVVRSEGGHVGPFGNSLSIASNDPVTPQYQMVLSGLRYNNARMEVLEGVGATNDMVVPFGVVSVGERQTRSFQITNTGTDPLEISRLAIGGVSSSFVPWLRASRLVTGFVGGANVYGPVGSMGLAAQRFTISTTEQLHKVEAYLKRHGAPGGVLYVQIEADVNGRPSGVAVDSLVSEPLDSSLIDPENTGDYDWYEFNFPTWPTLNAGQTYWMVIYRSVRDVDNYVTWGYGALVPGRSGATESSGAWTDAAYTYLYSIDTVLTSMAVQPNATRQVNVDFTCGADSADGVVAYGGIYHNDYKIHPDTGTRLDNPMQIVFTANKPDFSDLYVITDVAADAYNPDIGPKAIAWLSPEGVKVLRLNYPEPGLVPAVTVSLPGGTPGRPKTDGNYVVWEQDNAIWLYDIQAGQTRDLTGGLLGNERQPSISGSRVVYATDVNAAGVWDVRVMDLETGLITQIPEPRLGGIEEYPDISGDLVAWRTTVGANTYVYTYRLPAAGSSSRPVQLSVGQVPGARIPVVGNDLVAWVEQAGGAYQLRYFNMDTLEGGVVVDQLAAISDVPSLDGTLLTWATDRLGQWDIYAYYSPLPEGQTQAGPQIRGRVYQLTYGLADQINPSSSGVLIAYQEETATGWQVRYGRVPGVPNIIVEGTGVVLADEPATADIEEYTFDFGAIYLGIGASVPIRITNNGSDDTTIEEILSTDPRVSVLAADTLQAVPTDYSLRFGDSLDLLLTCPAAALGTLGGVQIFITSTDWDTPTLTIDITGTIANPAALRAGSITVTGDTSAGGVIHAVMNVYNEGLGAAAAFQSQFYLDGVALGFPVDTAGLAAGGNASVSADLVLPVLTNPGDHILSVMVDSANVIAEVNEANNQSQTTMWVLPAWDPAAVLPLTVSITDGTIHSNEPFTVTGKIISMGEATVPTFQFAYYWLNRNITSVADINPATDVLLGQYSLAKLDPDQLYTDTPRAFTLTAAQVPVAGTYYVAIVVDPFNALGEANEANNVVTKAVSASAINHAPTLTSITTLTGGVEDQAFPISYAVLAAAANEADVDGDPISFRFAGLISGSLVTGGDADSYLEPGETWHWTPAANQNGTLGAFSVTANDGLVDSVPPSGVAVRVNVAPVSDAPVAVADSATTNEDTVLTISAATLLANDTDPDGDTLSLVSVSGLAGTVGTVRKSGSSVIYTPPANWNGTDAFQYTVTDGTLTGTATVTVTVNPVGDVPVARDDYFFQVDEDQPLDIPAASLLANDTDADGEPVRVLSVSATPNTHGSVVLNGSTITYTPQPGWFSKNPFDVDVFQYTITDDVDGTSTAGVSVTVHSVGHAPTAVPDLVDTPEDVPVGIAVLANDYDIDGDHLTLESVTTLPDTIGQVVKSGSTVVYTPAANWSGVDTFEYTVNDGLGGQSTATVTVTVTAINDRPMAEALTTAMFADDPFVQVELAGTDVETPAGLLTFQIVTDGTHGHASVVGNVLTYVPDPAYGVLGDTIWYTATDADGLASIPEKVFIGLTQILTFSQASPALFYIGQQLAVKITVKGNRTATGTAQVTQGDNEFNIDTLTLNGSDAKTALSITGRTRSRISLGPATINGDLRSLKAAGVDLLGALGITGTARDIWLDDVIGSEILIGAGAGGLREKVSLRFDQVEDSRIDSDTAIASLYTTSWSSAQTAGGSPDLVQDEIWAPRMDKLTVRGSRYQPGDFEADLALTGDDSGRAALGMAKIARDLTSVAWEVAGTLGKLYVGNMVSGSNLHASGNIDVLQMAQVQSSNFVAGAKLSQITPTQESFVQGDFNAGARIGRVDVRGVSRSTARFVTDTNFYAPTMGPLALRNVDDAAGCELFVFDGTNGISRISYRDSESGTKWTWPRATLPRDGVEITPIP